MDKAELRAHFKELRDNIPADERRRIDTDLARQVCNLNAFERAELVLPYLAFGTEVETRDIIEAAWEAGKKVALPRCIPGTHDMAWYEVESFDGLVKSPFGVDEPADDPAKQIDPSDFEQVLCLVPGMTFDAQGYRLGYGGGFYDTFLVDFNGVSVGLCRSCQLSEEVESREEHDRPVEIVATEKGCFFVSSM